MDNQYTINSLCLGKKDSLCIEIQGMILKKGVGEVTITGNLSNSAHEAMILARSILLASSEVFTQYDYHLHFAYPATQKDGTSWGLACYLLLSFISGDLAYVPNLAATGELDLFGNVLPVKYIDEKLAAWGKSRCELLFIPKNNITPEVTGIYQVSSLKEVRDTLSTKIGLK